jgi:hypothetical protein
MPAAASNIKTQPEWKLGAASRCCLDRIQEIQNKDADSRFQAGALP